MEKKEEISDIKLSNKIKGIKLYIIIKQITLILIADFDAVCVLFALLYKMYSIFYFP